MILLTSDELNVSQQSCGGKWKIKNRCQHIHVIRAEYTPATDLFACSAALLAHLTGWTL